MRFETIYEASGHYKIQGKTGISTRLPSGYTELLYVEMPKKSYFDTGIKPTTNTRFRFKFVAETDNPNNFRLIGSNFPGLLVSGSNTTLFLNSANYSTIQTSAIIDGNEHILDIHGNKTELDGVSYNTDSVVASNTSIFINNLNATQVVDRIGHTKWYFIEHYENNVLTHNFIPAKRNSDNEIGMYDLVNNVFYTNAGSGAFIGGSVVVSGLKGNFVFDYSGIPSEYDRVEYIQSTGTQYIDTNYVPNANTKIIANIAFTQDSVDLQQFGCIKALSGVSPNTIYSRWHFGVYQNKLTNFRLSSASAGDIKVDYDSDYHIYTLENNSVGLDDTTLSVLDTENADYSFVLFARKSRTATTGDATITSNAKAKMKELKIYEGSTLIHNFIPVKKKSNNEYGLYDIVSKQFYGNAGTGTFTAGNVVPKKTMTYNTDTELNGLSIIESLLGNQSELVKSYNVSTSVALYFGNKTYNMYYPSDYYGLGFNVNVKASHKYLFYVYFDKQQDRTMASENWSEWRLVKDDGVSVSDSCALFYTYRPNEHEHCGIINVQANDTARYLRLYNNGNVGFDLDLDVPNYYVILDLTELGLDTLTAEQFYNQYKSLLPLLAKGGGKAQVCDTLDNQTGKIVRRIGKVDLGTLSWYQLPSSTYGEGKFAVEIVGKADYTNRNMYCSRYEASKKSPQDLSNGEIGTIFYGTERDIVICDTNYNNATDFKNSLSGVYLYYPLATPTKEYASTTRYLKKHANEITDINGNLVVAEEPKTWRAVPNDYDIVGYIEGTGTQYLNIGTIGKTGEYKIKAKVRTGDTISGVQAICGSRVDTGGTRFYICIATYQNIAKWDMAIKTDNWDSVSAQANTDYEIEADYISATRTLKKNGQQITSSSESLDTNLPLYVFAYNRTFDGTTANTTFKGRMYYFQIIGTDGNFIRNLVPVKKKSNNEYGMYDTVTKQFFGNSGSGSFTGGN